MQKRVIQLFTLAVFLLILVVMTPLSIFATTASQNRAASAFDTNPYSPAYQHSYRHGVMPTIAQLAQMKAYQQAHPNAVAAATSANTLAYGGGIDGIGVTSGTEKVYLVFWGTQWGTQSTDSSGNLTFSNDSLGGAPREQNMFKGLGLSLIHI